MISYIKLDLLALLRINHEAGNTDRIYEELTQEVMESVDYNPEQMGAWLLGYDVAAIANESTVKAITELLENKKESLVLQMAKSLSSNENALDITEALLSNFTQGVQTTIKKE